MDTCFHIKISKKQLSAFDMFFIYYLEIKSFNTFILLYHNNLLTLSVYSKRRIFNDMNDVLICFQQIQAIHESVSLCNVNVFDF
jgi:hypothetical protein